MDFTEPTNNMFSYNRAFPPLFFTKPTVSERASWENSMKSITREYFKVSRKFKVSAEVPLTNGSTAGEFAMYLLTHNHSKRNVH